MDYQINQFFGEPNTQQSSAPICIEDYIEDGSEIMIEFIVEIIGHHDVKDILFREVDEKFAEFKEEFLRNMDNKSIFTDSSSSYGRFCRKYVAIISKHNRLKEIKDICGQVHTNSLLYRTYNDYRLKYAEIDNKLSIFNEKYRK